MLSCAQELKRMVADNAIRSFDFMVIKFIDAGTLVARWKWGNGYSKLDH
jgi:hypothetical protein